MSRHVGADALYGQYGFYGVCIVIEWVNECVGE